MPETTPPSTTLPPTTTTVPATTTPTTTTMRRCQYSASPPVENVGFTGGTGTCTINTTDSGCPYTARSTASFVRIQSGGSGSTPDAVQYSVDLNGGAARVAFITIDQDGNVRCEIRQGGFQLFQPTTTVQAGVLWSTLDLKDASAQVVVDGRFLSFVARAPAAVSSDRAPRRVEGTVVNASGAGGTWLFTLPAGSGPPRVIAGQVLEISDHHVRFALTGRAGERVLFVLTPRLD